MLVGGLILIGFFAACGTNWVLWGVKQKRK